MADVQDLVERAVEDAAHRYLETYFAKRDLPGTLAFLSPLVSGFGTGADEVAPSFDALAACYARDCAQAPNPITYILHDAHVRTFSPESGVYSCRADISTTVHNQGLQLNGLRLTLVLCPETNVAQACDVAEAMRAEVAGKEFVGDLRLTASFGVASFKAGDSPETLIARADAALYAAKHQGRNRVCCAEK